MTIFYVIVWFNFIFFLFIFSIVMTIYVTFVWLFALSLTNLLMNLLLYWGLIFMVIFSTSIECINWTSSHLIFIIYSLILSSIFLLKASLFLMNFLTIFINFILSFYSFVLIDIDVILIKILFSLILTIYAQSHHQYDLFSTSSHYFISLSHYISNVISVVPLFSDHILSFSHYLNNLNIWLSCGLLLCIDFPNNQIKNFPILMISHNICPSLHSKNLLLLLDCNQRLIRFSLISYQKIMKTTSLVVY